MDFKEYVIVKAAEKGKKCKQGEQEHVIDFDDDDGFVLTFPMVAEIIMEEISDVMDTDKLTLAELNLAAFKVSEVARMILSHESYDGEYGEYDNSEPIEIDIIKMTNATLVDNVGNPMWFISEMYFLKSWSEITLQNPAYTKLNTPTEEEFEKAKEDIARVYCMLQDYIQYLKDMDDGRKDGLQMWNLINQKNSDIQNIRKVYPTQQEDVAMLVRAIKRTGIARKIVIFGSLVRSACNPWSDLGIYCEIEKPFEPEDPYSFFDRALDVSIDLWDNFSVGVGLMKEIRETGVIVYESERKNAAG